MRNTLELVEVDSEELEDVLRRVEQALDEKDSTLVRRVFESYAYVTELVEDKDTSIRRLRRVSSRTLLVARRGPTCRLTAARSPLSVTRWTASMCSRCRIQPSPRSRQRRPVRPP